jgi:hypothetical protein
MQVKLPNGTELTVSVVGASVAVAAFIAAQQLTAPYAIGFLGLLAVLAWARGGPGPPIPPERRLPS